MRAQGSNPRVLAFVSAPIDILHVSCTRSISYNDIRVEGGKAFAAVLKDTQLTSLK